MSKIIYTLKRSSIVAAFWFLVSHDGYSQVAKFQQQNTNDGLVVIEAENYSEKIAPSASSSWEAVTTPENYSGAGGLQANPIDPNFVENKDLSFAQSNAPIVRYVINFVKSDLLYVWARTSHTDGFDDSFWLGLDEAILGATSNDAMSYLTSEQAFADEWYWIHYTQGSDTAKFEIPSTGIHTFEIYMREQALKIDKIILTTNKDYVPEGVGPGETTVTSVSDSKSLPANFGLKQNYPNPFNPSTTFEFSIPSESYVSLTVYSALGIEVAQVISQEMSAGVHTTQWNASGFASGVYFYRLQAGSYTATERLLLVK